MKQLADALGLEAIQARSRLVKQENRRVRDELDADCTSLSLSVCQREHFLPWITDWKVGDVCHSKFMDELLYKKVLLMLFRL